MTGKIVTDFAYFDSHVELEELVKAPSPLYAVHEHLTKDSQKIIEDVALESLEGLRRFCISYRPSRNPGCFTFLVTSIKHAFGFGLENTIKKINACLKRVLIEKREFIKDQLVEVSAFIEKLPAVVDEKTLDSFYDTLQQVHLTAHTDPIFKLALARFEKEQYLAVVRSQSKPSHIAFLVSCKNSLDCIEDMLFLMRRLYPGALMPLVDVLINAKNLNEFPGDQQSAAQVLIQGYQSRHKVIIYVEKLQEGPLDLALVHKLVATLALVPEMFRKEIWYVRGCEEIELQLQKAPESDAGTVATLRVELIKIMKKPLTPKTATKESAGLETCLSIEQLKKIHEAIVERRSPQNDELDLLSRGLLSLLTTMSDEEQSACNIQSLLATVFTYDPEAKRTTEALLKTFYDGSLEEVLKDNLLGITRRIRLLAPVASESHLSLTDLYRLAYFIQLELPSQAHSGVYFKKNSPKKTPNTKTYDIPRSVIYSAKDNELYILLKSKTGTAVMRGGYKKISPAIRVFPVYKMSSKVQTVVQAVCREYDIYNNEDHVKQEAHIWSLFKNSPGVWPLHNVVEYPKYQAWKKIYKTALFMPRASSDLAHSDSMSLEEELQRAHSILRGLDAIHKQGYVHADIKQTNVLVDMDPLDTGWIDFGFSFLSKSGQAPQVFDMGYYGSIDYTPPEVFGQKNFTGDFFKADMWALGCTLLTLHAPMPSWSLILKYFFKKRKESAVADYVQQEVRRLIIDAVEKPLERLQEEAKSRELTLQERYTMLVYHFMRLDPSLRYTAAQGLEELTELLEVK